MARRGVLATYNEKRDFARTPEPAGKAERSPKGNLFIVQKHAATRLHWDFRLELDGVLKSWAVTKGPSPDPDDKRLAVRTEDHPLSYAQFEGTIPKGEYGGGTVMLWDKGSWAPIEGKSAKDLEKGHLHFRLEGERMKGEWLLIRLKPRPGEKRENWLLRKIDDAQAGVGDVLVETALTSVLTGRTMAEIASDRAGTQSLSGKKGDDFTAIMEKTARHNARAAKPSSPAKGKALALPRFEKPQLATLVDHVPTGNGWMHEIKFDGYRALAAVSGENVAIYTRSGLDWTDKFGPLVNELRALDLPTCLIDGEVVAYDQNGNPDFSALQGALKRGHGAQKPLDLLAFHAFDLLRLNGEDLRPLPNIERKERLEALLAHAHPPIHVADHVIGAGEKLFAAMCGAGQEGIIAKRIDAPYRGERTKNWVKVKCTLRQEFVILGWSKSNARARPFAALLLGQCDGDTLVYKGKVGTGYNADTFEMLARKMAPLARKTAAAEVPRTEARKATWIAPRLVAEIAFAEFTADGHIRHGSFVGLREDKDASTVTPEKATAAPEPSDSGIKVTHPERVIFEGGRTKGELKVEVRVADPARSGCGDCRRGGSDRALLGAGAGWADAVAGADRAGRAGADAGLCAGAAALGRLRLRAYGYRRHAARYRGDPGGGGWRAW